MRSPAPGFILALSSISSAASADLLQVPSWLDRLSIRQTSDSRIVPRPANVMATFPANEQDTFAVDANGRFNAAPDSVSDRLELGPFAEYHHLKPGDKPQQILKLGLDSDYTPFDLVESGWSPRLSISG